MRIWVRPARAFRRPHQLHTVSLDHPQATVAIIDPAGNARDRLDGKSDRHSERQKNADLIREPQRFGAAYPEEDSNEKWG
jgi:hypothetical protein